MRALNRHDRGRRSTIIDHKIAAAALRNRVTFAVRRTVAVNRPHRAATVQSNGSRRRGVSGSSGTKYRRGADAIRQEVPIASGCPTTTTVMNPLTERRGSSSDIEGDSIPSVGERVAQTENRIRDVEN